jgi:hypothetical protein
VEQAKRARWDGGTYDHFDVFMVKMLIKRSILGVQPGIPLIFQVPNPYIRNHSETNQT